MAELTIPTERRLAGLKLALGYVREAYPGEPDPENVAALIGRVSDALEREDLTSALVHGTRLLSMAELAELIRLLEGSDPPARPTP